MNEDSNDAGNDAHLDIPFASENFKALIGLDSDGLEIRMRPVISDRGCIDGKEGMPNLTDPAVFMARWLTENWDSLRNMAAIAYNANVAHETAKRNLRALAAANKADAEERARPQGTGKLISIDGGKLE